MGQNNRIDDIDSSRMVAPKYGSTESSSTPTVVQDATLRNSDKRRQQVLLRLISQASDIRSQGNELFKARQYLKAEIRYSDAIHALQKASHGTDCNLPSAPVVNEGVSPPLRRTICCCVAPRCQDVHAVVVLFFVFPKVVIEAV